MATYVNDLRLKEIATGDESGTWGTSTNTNLELIGEALSFGTEAITTNADTHTTTVADGSTDPGRAMYLKYTGTLDSACTITIAPNTISRMQFIENGTSGSQNIIISQGSGANITIPPGDTKAVYLDGAGSGAAVVDAFASLSVVDLKVQDDLTVTDDATIGGTLGVTGIVTLTDDLIIGDGKTIGSASDVDAITIAANGQLTLTQTLIGTALDISGDIDVDGTTNLDVVDIDGAVDMATTLAVGGVVTANAGVVVDNFTLDGTTLALSSGDFTLDVAGMISLNADNAGTVIFEDASVQYLVVENSSSDAVVRAGVQDKDILFKGNDGGSQITALTLDMSGGGLAIFGGGINSSGSTNSTTHSLLTLESSVDANPSRMNMFFQSGQGRIAAISGRQNAGGSDAYGALDFNTSNAGTLATRMTILNNGQLELKGGTTTGVQVMQFTNSSVTIANDATLDVIAPNTGSLVSVLAQKSHLGNTFPAGLFYASDNSITEVSDAEGAFTTTSGTAARINVFMSSGSLRVENKNAGCPFAFGCIDYRGV